MLGGALLPVVATLGAFSVVSDWVDLTLQIPLPTLLAAGMVGLHIRQKKRLGRLGRVGFVVAISAAAYSLGSIVFALYTLYAGISETLAPTIFAVSMVSMLMLILGSILLGIASLHAEVLPRWVAWLLTIGSVAAVVPFSGIPLFGVGWTALGYALWSEKGESVR